MIIGNNIQKYRKLKGITQKELANRCGCATGTIQQYELGKREPKFEILCTIAQSLNIPVEYLIESVSIGVMTENDVKAIDYFVQHPTLAPIDDLDISEHKLLSNYRFLNEEGKKEASKRVEELTEINRYTNK